MAVPALPGGRAIGLNIKTQDRPGTLFPANASRISVEQFSVDREMLPIIGGHLTARCYILKHLDFIMFSIQVYLTCISYGKICCKRAQTSACRAEKRLPEIYVC